MIIFGVVAPIIPIWIGYTTENATLFYTMNFLAGMLGAAALGAAAATTQDLVLPRMRGTATAAFFLGTTLVGLSFGPYMVGQISDLAGTIVDGKPIGDLRTGILSLIGVAPVALVLLLYAYRAVPQAEATIAERAAAAEEVADPPRPPQSREWRGGKAGVDIQPAGGVTITPQAMRSPLLPLGSVFMSSGPA